MDRSAYDTMQRIEGDHWWFAARRQILSQEIAGLGLPATAEILEVGCGPGGNLRMLAQFGRVRAIEPDEASRAHAAEAGFEVRGGLLPDRLPAFDTQFDLLAAFDVIEHVDDDEASVSALSRLLRPGGRFIATVPANAWMWSRHDELHHHKRRYNLAAFREMFARAGLKVQRATYFNTLLFPPIAAARVVKAVTGDQGGDDAMPSPAVNTLLRNIFAAETTILKHADLPFGVSILLVAQRPHDA